MTDSNNTDHGNDDIIASYELEMTGEDIWIVVCGVVNIFVNAIIISIIFKSRLRNSTYMYFINYAIFDIIQQLANPITCRIFTEHHWFQHFLVNHGFKSVYMVSIMGGVIVLFSMILKNHVKYFNSMFVYVISGIWIGATGAAIASYNLANTYSLEHFCVYTYFIVVALLMVTLYIQTVKEVLSPGRQLSLEYQTCTLLSVAYSCSRIVLALIYLVSLMMFVSRISQGSVARILLGLLPLNALINFFIFLRFDVKFKTVACNIFRLNYSSGLTRRTDVNFVNLPEQDVNILINGE